MKRFDLVGSVLIALHLKVVTLGALVGHASVHLRLEEDSQLAGVSSDHETGLGLGLAA